MSKAWYMLIYSLCFRTSLIYGLWANLLVIMLTNPSLVVMNYAMDSQWAIRDIRRMLGFYVMICLFLEQWQCWSTMWVGGDSQDKMIITFRRHYSKLMQHVNYYVTNFIVAVLIQFMLFVYFIHAWLENSFTRSVVLQITRRQRWSRVQWQSAHRIRHAWLRERTRFTSFKGLALLTLFWFNFRNLNINWLCMDFP